MSLKFINDFQNQLYKILASESKISEVVNKIYFGVVQDGKCPFLLIQLKKAEDLSKTAEPIYAVEFEILAYAKDHHHSLLVSLTDNVINILDSTEIFFTGYKVIGLKANEVKFEKAKDLVLNKVAIKYKALIRREL
jgi:hypothetical protein